MVDKSLLKQEEGIDGEPRFAMLETIREYALERLEQSGEPAALKQGHAAHFLALAEQAELAWSGPDEVRWLDRLESEHNNFRAALAWALEGESGE